MSYTYIYIYDISSLRVKNLHLHGNVELVALQKQTIFLYDTPLYWERWFFKFLSYMREMLGFNLGPKAKNREVYADCRHWHGKTWDSASDIMTAPYHSLSF
jgi:hypothetical protein